MEPSEFVLALHALMTELDDTVEALLRSEFGITHSQLAFLMPLLREGDLDVSSLAASTRVSTPAVSKRVPWFVERGLIKAGHPAGEAKRVRLSLTPAGRDLAEAASHRLTSQLDDLLADWPTTRRAAFHDLAVELTTTIRAHRDKARDQR